MKSPSLPPIALLILLPLSTGIVDAAGQHWASRLNVAEGEVLLWLEAEVAPEEMPKVAEAGGAPTGEDGTVDGAGDGAGDDAARPAADDATEEEPPADAVAEPAEEGAPPPPADGEAPAGDGGEPPPAEAEAAGEAGEAPMEGGAEEGPKDRFAAVGLPFLTPQPQGGVILLHDHGGHPDWPGVISPLRRGLPEHGWATLSIEFPDGRGEWRIRQAVKRVEAALRFYNERQLFNVALVGHGEGAMAATRYLADNPRPGIAAYVAVGHAAPPEVLGGLLLLEGIHIPMLELFGERDTFEVLSTAHDRELAVLRGGNPKYRQQRIAGADHFFSATEATLVELVRRWLKRYASGMEINLGSSEGRSIRHSLGLNELPGAGDATDGAPSPALTGDIELDDSP